MADYANVTEANPQVEDAAATLRWTGSWYTVFITAEPQCGGNLSRSLAQASRQYVNRYRLAGQDIELDRRELCPARDQSDRLRRSRLFPERCGTGAACRCWAAAPCPMARPAFFTPGNFTLGQTVYLSPIYAAARTVAGVQTRHRNRLSAPGRRHRDLSSEGRNSAWAVSGGPHGQRSQFSQSRPIDAA